jgi:ubiquinone/menaquinone biosynthesis C-methylase UbiE
VKRARFLALAALLGAASLYIGLRTGALQPARPVHPLTGRPIAGIATNADWMDRATREQEEAPAQALALIGVRPGMVVADVGAGSGYMTLRLAALVGPAGKVYANDIQPALLRIVQEKARAAKAGNIEVVLGSATDARLPEHAIDLALLVDVYHEFQHPREMLQSLRRSLKSDGRLVLIEYRKEDPTIPIAPTHRMSVAETKTEIEAEGFTFEQVLTGLPRQHIVIFRKGGRS